MQAEDILAELSSAFDFMPVEALHAAATQREALTEPLLDALGTVCNAAEQDRSLAESQILLGEMAMYVLAQFREPRAFPLFERLCHLPVELREEWLGDILTQDYPSFLASTCAGRHHSLLEMAEDASLDFMGRWVALDALLVLVANGAWPRSSMIDWLGEFWRRWQPLEKDPDYTPLAHAATDLAAAELLPLVRAAFDAGQTEWREVDMAYYEQCCADGALPVPDLDNRRLRYVEDAAEQMVWQTRYRDMLDDHADLFDRNLVETYVRPAPKTGRNDPCHCGSGRKYKKCCLLVDEG